MTALARTYPEPAGDIAAQMAALVDPDHPKRALWVSLGTRMPMVSAFDRFGACDDAGWVALRGAAAVVCGLRRSRVWRRLRESWITLSAGRRRFRVSFSCRWCRR